MHVLLAAAATLLAGILFGYAFGYDVGWERAMSVPVQNGQVDASIDSFDDCAAAGHPVMESFPRQCRTPDGRLFVEEVVLPVEPDGGIGTTPGTGGCSRAGCSSQLCVEASEARDIVTDCMYRPEYACYPGAECGRQANGECGWIMTPELAACLANPPRE